MFKLTELRTSKSWPHSVDQLSRWLSHGGHLGWHRETSTE